MGPLILGLLIEYTKSKHHPTILGIFYCLLLFLSTTLQTILNSQYFERMFNVGTKMRSIFMNLIYKKALVLSNDSRKQSTVGEMINLIAGFLNKFKLSYFFVILILFFNLVNAQYFNEFPHHITNAWSTTLIILGMACN